MLPSVPRPNRPASTEQLARTDRVGRGLLNDASSTDVRAPQEHGRGISSRVAERASHIVHTCTRVTDCGGDVEGVRILEVVVTTAIFAAVLTLVSRAHKPQRKLVS